jgi:hypothetical protein
MKKKVWTLVCTFLLIFSISSSNFASDPCEGDSCIPFIFFAGLKCKIFKYYCGGEEHWITACVDPNVGSGTVLGNCILLPE